MRVPRAVSRISNPGCKPIFSMTPLRDCARPCLSGDGCPRVQGRPILGENESKAIDLNQRTPMFRGLRYQPEFPGWIGAAWYRARIWVVSESTAAVSLTIIILLLRSEEHT